MHLWTLFFRNTSLLLLLFHPYNLPNYSVIPNLKQFEIIYYQIQFFKCFAPLRLQQMSNLLLALSKHQKLACCMKKRRVRISDLKGVKSDSNLYAKMVYVKV